MFAAAIDRRTHKMTKLPTIGEEGSMRGGGGVVRRVRKCKVQRRRVSPVWVDRCKRGGEGGVLVVSSYLLAVSSS